MMHKIIVGALGFVASVAATPLEIVERNSCRDDSLYKCFADREYAHSASAYCSALAPFTKTVTAVKPTVTTTVLKTSTAATITDFISSTTTVYTATVPSSTEVVTSTATETATVTTTVTAGSQTQLVEKRGGQERKPQPPHCMVNKCFAYSPDRVTEACRCINVPPRTVTVTHTACSITKTVTSTSTKTPSVTATSWQTVSTALIDGAATTTTTVTTTAITTTTVTATPSAQNLIPDGDFSSGLNGWAIINSAPAAWVNPGTSTQNSLDGTSNAFHVTNVINQGLYFLGSPQFGVQASSAYTFSFYVENSSSDLQWTTHIVAVFVCGSMTLATADLSQAQQGPNGYLFSTTTFNTPTTTDAQTLQQLHACQAQIVFHPGTAPPNTWFLADVSAAYLGPITTPQ